VVSDARSQGFRGSRLNQCPLLSVRTLSSWSLAWNERSGDGAGDEVGGVFPGLSRGAGRLGKDKEVEAGGGMFAVSLVVTMEGVVAATGSGVLCMGEDDVPVFEAIGLPMGLPFCLTWGLSLSSAFTDSLLASLPRFRSVHSFETQPGCW